MRSARARTVRADIAASFACFLGRAFGVLQVRQAKSRASPAQASGVSHTCDGLVEAALRGIEHETEIALAEPHVSFLVTRRVASLARQIR